ncbi:hypothetical protein S83_014870 [Arachis hypogaea]
MSYVHLPLPVEKLFDSFNWGVSVEWHFGEFFIKFTAAWEYVSNSILLKPFSHAISSPSRIAATYASITFGKFKRLAYPYIQPLSTFLKTLAQLACSGLSLDALSIFSLIQLSWSDCQKIVRGFSF